MQQQTLEQLFFILLLFGCSVTCSQKDPYLKHLAVGRLKEIAKMTLLSYYKC